MKEATGELSTTVIAVVAIAAVLALFTGLLLPTLRSSITSRMHCSEAYGCTCTNGTCACLYDEVDANGTITTKNVNCDDPNA
ncbi:MAG: hypothetical protein IJO63_04880 [Bacilli bacterium]|nr:hypothetical protein [Bacilli bacterium]